MLQQGSGLWWYDVTTMQPISFWDDPPGCVFRLEFSPDGKLIILVTKHNPINLKVMDIARGECVLEIEEQSAYGDFACSSNGKWIAIADYEGHVRVLDIHTGEQIAQMDRGEHKWKTNDIEGLTFTPDGERLASMVRNHRKYSKENVCLNPDDEAAQIYVWEPQTGKPIVKFPGETFAISDDSRLIAGGSTDGTLRYDELLYSDIAVWDIAASEQIAYFTEHNDEIMSISVFFLVETTSHQSDDILLEWEIATGSVQRVAPNFDKPFYAKQRAAIRY